MNKLYRGVSKCDYADNNGKVLPKGSVKKVVMKYGGRGIRYDGKFTYGPSENNTARSHQIDSGMHGGCGISTTRDKIIAESFATTNGIMDGFVYVIDESKLDGLNIEKYEFSDAENLHEKEVTLITGDCGELPSEVIIDKYEVNVA